MKFVYAGAHNRIDQIFFSAKQPTWSTVGQEYVIAQ